MSFKRRVKWSIALILILISAFCTTIPVFAEQEASYSIKDYTSKVTINPDGSVHFDETVTYHLLQEKVEIIRPLLMANSSKVEDMEILRLYSADSEASEADMELVPVKQTDQPVSSDGESYIYELADAEDDIYHITIPFEGRKHEEVTFVYRYKMLDTVFLYNDVAVFYWNYLIPEEIRDVKNIDIQVSLPEAIPVDQWNGYARGAAYAQKEVLEDGKFHLTVDNLREGEYLESILLLPKALFPEGRKIIDNYAEEEIVSELAAWEDEASRARREEELRYYSGWAIGIMAMLLCIGTGLLLYLKTRAKAVGSDGNKAGDLVNSSISPAELGALLKGGKAGVREFITTVLFLIQRRYLELQYEENGSNMLILRDDASKNELNSHEEYVLNWLTADSDNEQGLSLNALDQIVAAYGKDYKHKISTWQKLVAQRIENNDTSDNISRMKKWALGAVPVSLIAGALSWFSLNNLWAGVLAGVCALALAAYIISLKNTNEHEEFVKAEWMRRKDELLAKLSDEQDLVSLIKWEEELIYALPLGIADKVLDRLLQLYKDSAFEDGNLTILNKNNLPWLSRTLDNLK